MILSFVFSILGLVIAYYLGPQGPNFEHSGEVLYIMGQIIGVLLVAVGLGIGSQEIDDSMMGKRKR